MKSYQRFSEAFKSWADAKKNSNVRKEAEKAKKKLKGKQVLGYSLTNDEFTTFDDEADFKDWSDETREKWVKVESLEIFEAFNFDAAVKLDMLNKSDKKYVDILKKKGWIIDAFNLTSKGFEITIQHKNGRGRAKFVEKNPYDAIRVAAEKAV